jgi:hypothetical protein
MELVAMPVAGPAMESRPAGVSGFFQYMPLMVKLKYWTRSP